jgi:beta-glucosidase
VLKGDWGYQGWVMSDWGAVHDVGYFNAGLDQQSGAEIDKAVWFDTPLKLEYQEGRVSKQRLSDAVRRILRSVYAVGADQPAPPKPIDYDADAKVARASASEGIVLLKNDGALPLAKSGKSIIVIGGYAGTGVMSGGGSSQVIPRGGAAAVSPIQLHWIVHKPIGELIMPSPPYQALQDALPGVSLTWDAGNDTPAAAARAARADIAVVFATKWETEGRDSGDLSLTEGQDQLIEAVAKANPNTIVVLETGNPVLMPWLDEVRAVVEAWYPGQKGGDAIADVLTGAVDPSGRLPITFPATEAQNPRGPLSGLGEEDGSKLNDVNETVEYPEGANVGYRGYAARGLRPLFPFGYGLSYTRFEHGPLKLHGGKVVKARFSVRNTGDREGLDVPQLYLVNAAGQPVLRLAGFDKLDLKPGESGKVELSVDPRLLAQWDKEGDKDGWLVKAGSYGFAVGDSAAELGPVVSVKLEEQRLKP